MEKRSHLGMAGHFAAMAEFLYRGYNVAVPSVDVGDDVYVVEDRGGAMWRLQVKTADGTLDERRGADQRIERVACSFGLSRRQLREAKQNELFFMFVVRWESRWRFILVSRRSLGDIRDEFVASDRTGKGGRKPLSDDEASGDSLTLRIDWSENDAFG